MSTLAANRLFRLGAGVAIFGLVIGCHEADAAPSMALASAASPADAGPLRIDIDTLKGDAGTKWGDATKALSSCRSADIVIVYPAGSAYVRVRPAQGACAIDMTMDLEGGGWRVACATPGGRAWTWNLVADDKGPLQGPPRRVQAESQSVCREVK